MKQVDLIKAISELTEVSIKDTTAVVKGLSTFIKDNIVAAKEIKLDVGTFKLKETSERAGRNPKTSEAITIKASRGLTFKQLPSTKKELTATL